MMAGDNTRASNPRYQMFHRMKRIDEKKTSDSDDEEDRQQQKVDGRDQKGGRSNSSDNKEGRQQQETNGRGQSGERGNNNDNENRKEEVERRQQQETNGRGQSGQQRENNNDNENPKEEVEEIKITKVSFHQNAKAEDAFMDIQFNDGSLSRVKRKAYNTLERSMDSLKTQPTPFYKSKYAAFAIAQVCGKDFLEFAIPDLDSLPEQLDVDAIDHEVPKTWETPLKDDKTDWVTFRVVYNRIKKRKDSEARADGQPSSGIKEAESYRARYGEWQRMAALYRQLFPKDTKEMVLDRMTGDLKACKGLPTLQEETGKVILQVQNARKRHAAKVRKIHEKLSDQRRAAKKAAADARDKAEKAGTRKRILEAKAKKISSIQKRRKIQQEAQAEQKRQEELICQSESQAAAVRNLMQQQQALLSNNGPTSIPPRPKGTVKKNDISQLDAGTSPREMVNKYGCIWEPPIRRRDPEVEEVGTFLYSGPGDSWKSDSTKKVALLTRLHDCLFAEEGLFDAPLTFHNLMSQLGIDDAPNFVEFDHRVFIFAVALILRSNKCRFGDIVDILEALWQSNPVLLFANDMASANTTDMQTVINSKLDRGRSVDSSVVETLITFSRQVNNRPEGKIPDNPTALKELHLSDIEQAVLFQDVFGGSALVVGEDTRKIAVALNLFDWEEFVEKKVDTQMGDITESDVRKSYQTWLPQKFHRTLHNVMQSFGEHLSRDAKGDYGRLIKAIDRHFAGGDKKVLKECITTITQFYKATKT